ncbi:MAG: 30S ribosomal protein S21 [Candidatus Woesebacteria bacterium GW2011_GWB1_39_12]|uniref:Small ribosomal subunit protein bS21 n=1 Tax=Candidatus Woesebacteria bacterium GW2011_GWB1_39_12 TaxID=1618574 RepID=A0A0G0PHH2_9BACT|nr:MAG: 30S ribosomal protein S21 [Candidatus Woesebacteria bacterium GW2011_GWB1_39_12]
MSNQSKSSLPGPWIGVKVMDGNINNALKLLKKKVKDAGLVEELQDRQAFEKPSISRRKILKLAKFNQKIWDRDNTCKQ